MYVGPTFPLLTASLSFFQGKEKDVSFVRPWGTRLLHTCLGLRDDVSVTVPAPISVFASALVLSLGITKIVFWVRLSDNSDWIKKKKIPLQKKKNNNNGVADLNHLWFNLMFSSEVVYPDRSAGVGPAHWLGLWCDFVITRSENSDGVVYVANVRCRMESVMIGLATRDYAPYKICPSSNWIWRDSQESRPTLYYTLHCVVLHSVYAWNVVSHCRWCASETSILTVYTNEIYI